jgi:CheY-like chemotaxis protein/HPt (histidine-containing phosphotransfer) domain-containing protein
MAGLLLDTPLSHEQHGYVETIHSSSEALLTIINDILDFSKIESGKLEVEHLPLDLRGCLEEALDLLAPKAAEKKLELAYQMEDGVPARVLGDTVRLRQVLVNLIGNAIKFTSLGEVFIQVKPLGGQGAATGGGGHAQLQFSVRDTGIGIPVDRLARLFKSFSQADASTTRQYGGTGLGLAISRRLVELMGGNMWVESVPDKGSTFHFTLPLVPAGDVAVPVAKERPSQLARLRLLVVDDNPTNMRILTLQTSKWGMIPQGAQSAAQALDWLRAGQVFDLAILDMQMPGMDGLMLAREIRKLPGAGSMPLVLLTSMGVRSDQPGFQNIAFAGCLPKPIKPAQLQDVLVRAVSGTTPAARKSSGVPKLDSALASRQPLRILLCDDNAINQKVALRLLQQMGYQADMAANGIEALAALDRQHYDLVFMDVMMPEMSGLEASRIIRQRQLLEGQFETYKPGPIVIAMTANAMQGDREQCLAAGMDDYLAKPVRLEDIRTVVERWGARASIRRVDNRAVTEPTTGRKPGPTPGAEPPVQMDRLVDFADGNPESLRELLILYLSQTTKQMGDLEAAVRTGATQEVRRLAHSCAGASATCGAGPLVQLLRQLEQSGADADLATSTRVWADTRVEFERVRHFFDSYLGGQSQLLPESGRPKRA